MANTITGIRILCAVLLLIVPAFSSPFYIFYLFGGLTDALDGAVARKLGKATSFGAAFDTAADMIFVCAVLIKIISSLMIPVSLLFLTVLIAAIKTGSIITGYIKYHRFCTVHSTLNRICGGLLFILPLFIGTNAAWQAKAPVIVFAILIAVAAAVQEFTCILKGNFTR